MFLFELQDSTWNYLNFPREITNFNYVLQLVYFLKVLVI